MFLSTTNAFNVGFEYPAHCVDMFKFKFLPNSSLEDFLPTLFESFVVLFLYSLGHPSTLVASTRLSIPVLQLLEGKDDLCFGNSESC